MVFCTYFDRNYLPKGITLLESLFQFNSNYKVYVICLDEVTRLVLQALYGEKVSTIPFFQLENKDSILKSKKNTRSLVEYYWTATPSACLYIMDQIPEGEVLVYLDSDMYFFHSPEQILWELGQASVLIHGHNFSSYLENSKIFGLYNVGMLAFRKNMESRKVLQWWRKKCLNYCSNTIAYDEDNLMCYGDQKYLEYFFHISSEVKIASHIGMGIAPWNHIGHTFRKNTDNEVFIDDNVPVVFYHFHAFSLVNHYCVIPAKHLDYFCSLASIEFFAIPYLEKIEEAFVLIKGILPEYEMTFHDVANLSNTLLAKSEYANALKDIGFNYSIALPQEYLLTLTPQLKGYEQLFEGKE